MMRGLLIRGMAAGLLAGLLAAGFAAIVGEPLVSHAISFEDQLRRLSGQPADPVVVTRGVQSSIGMLSGMMIYGVSFGGAFAIVFGLAYGRLGRIRARATAALLGGAGLLAIYVVPALKYPANPPSIGDPGTIGHRTQLYATILVVSLGAMVAAVAVGRNLAARARFRGWDIAVACGLAYVVVVGAVMALLPGVNEVPRAFPAPLLWRFRIASAGIEVVLWAVLALSFGIMAERAVEPDFAAHPAVGAGTRAG
jgi:hypothetical protein